jgi:hypothetical protein
MRKVISAARFAAFAMVAAVLTGEAAATTSRAMQLHCTLVPEYSKGDLSKGRRLDRRQTKGLYARARCAFTKNHLDEAGW